MTVDVVGLHVVAGTVWFVPVDVDGQLVSYDTDRLSTESASLTTGRTFAEFLESMETVLDDLSPNRVALLAAGTAGRTQRASDMRRGAVDALIAVAVHRARRELDIITHQEVERVLGHRPSSKELLDVVSEGNSSTRNWSIRGVALATARTLQGRV